MDKRKFINGGKMSKEQEEMLPSYAVAMKRATDTIKAEKTQEERQQGLDQFQSVMFKGKILMSRYRCAMMEVETKFKVLNEELSLQSEHNPIESIKTRLKSPESIFGKLKRKNLPLTLEAIEGNLYDIAGVKVICCFIDDIYMLADCLIRQDDVTLIEMKDYIRSPKGNGYRSLHLIISIPIFLQNEKRDMKVEVQLRTIAMEFWANLEHQMRYKKDLSPELLEEISAELGACAEASAELDLRMQEIRYTIELAGSEV